MMGNEDEEEWMVENGWEKEVKGGKYEEEGRKEVEENIGILGEKKDK